jgi:DNA-binding transcriptional regulator YdaS (Cro superfamily)
MQTAIENGIEKAVRLAGSQTALGQIFDPPVSPQAVQKWVAKGQAPGERCREIEKKFGGQVTRYELNSEVFGDAPEEVTHSDLSPSS